MKLIHSIFILLLAMLLSYSANSQTVGDYNLLIVEGTLDVSAQAELDAMGHTTTLVPSASLIDSYDYSPYDAIIFMYNSLEPPGMTAIITENEACNLGIIAMRGENIINTCGLGSSMTWSSTSFTIENNTHYISSPFALGVLDLGYTYNSNCIVGLGGTTILGSVSSGNGSLIVHDTYKRVVSPYYGHTSGMPWLPDAEILMDRIIAWVVDPCCVASTSSISESACESYTVPSGDETYFASGIYNDTIPNATGCDSVITIDLSINNTTNSITETSCDPYVVPSGDESYSTSGIYMDTIPNAAGCDSILTIDVTITVVDVTVIQVDEVLTAAASGATYQWIDCSDNSLISGATAQNYTATSNGDYAVIVTASGCTDTSACFTISNIGIIENPTSVLKIHPNPFKEEFVITWSENLGPLHVEIMDISGRKVWKSTYKKSDEIIIRLDVPTGIYFINLTSSNFSLSKKIVKR